MRKVAYGRAGESYPSERVQRAAWKEAGVELGGQIEDVWFDRETARNKGKAERWAERDAMAARLSREGAPVHLVVTHLYLLGSSFEDLNATLAAIAQPGNTITITSEAVTLPLEPGVPQLAALIVNAQRQQQQKRAAHARSAVRAKPQSKLTLAQEAEVRTMSARGMSQARIGEEFGVSASTINRILKRAR